MSQSDQIGEDKIVNEENHRQDEQGMQQEEDESSNFTEDQIEIIRSYIGELSLEKKQNDTMIEEVIEKIRKQPPLETKSAKHIHQLIYKLIQQETNLNPKINVQHSLQDQQNENNPNTSTVNAINFKPSVIDPKPFIMSQQENVFLSRSLFKSFNQTLLIPNVSVPQHHDTPQSFRKIHLKPSIQILKSSSSNGFITVNQNGKSNQNIMEIQNKEMIEIPSFSKKNTNQFKQTTQNSVSKRKIKPTQPLLIDPLYTSQQKIEWSQNNTHDCHLIMQKKMGKRTGTTGKDAFYVNERLSGIYNEYFYSNYDRAYFAQQNQISKLINLLGFDAKKLTFKQFKTIKSVLPSPKLFNLDFIINQQIKLNEFRTQLRQAPKQRTKQELELLVGRQVIALHPMCGHLHLGTILAIYKENQYMVKFTRPQLGTQKVLDINISTRALSNTNKTAVQNIDFESMVVVIRLLEYKGELIQKFRGYNNTIQLLKTQNKQPDNNLLQQYGWVGSTINILSIGLRHILAKFRIRGLNSTSNYFLTKIDQQLVGRNFSSLLINPLNLMSKQLYLSPQQSDIQTSNQIKRMAQNRSNTRLEFSLRRLTQKHSHYLEEKDMNPQEKQNINLLIKNFVGILLNFRYEGRNFNVQSNQFLDNIQKIIDPQYSEEFNQIHSNMHNIVKKINESQ